MRAIRTIHKNPDYVEWVHITEQGEIATCASPQLFPETCTLLKLQDYWAKLGYKFNSTNVPIEMVNVELNVTNIVDEESELFKFTDEKSRGVYEFMRKIFPDPLK